MRGSLGPGAALAVRLEARGVPALSSQDPGSEIHVLPSAQRPPPEASPPNEASDAGASAGHDHGPHEAFPREAVRDLIGGSLAGIRRRELLQDGALTLALALLAQIGRASCRGRG